MPFQPEVWKNATLLYHGVDISGYSNEFSIDGDYDEKEFTNWASAGWKEFKPGLLGVAASINGFLNEPEPDKSFFEQDQAGFLATRTNPCAAGDFALALFGCRSKYTPRRKVGELAGYSVSMKGTGVLARGQMLEVVSATGNGSSAVLTAGAVSATQSAYAHLHVLSGTFTSLDLVIESDDADGFPSPVTRLTFPQVVAAPAFLRVSVPGAITDTKWRTTRTLVGASCVYRVFLGIQ